MEQIARFWPTVKVEHITYDPKLFKGEFNIVRGSTHDGTLIFTHENIQRVLLPVVNGTCFMKGKEPTPGAKIKDVHYTIGPMRYAATFAPTKMRERIRMAVIGEYIYE